MKKRIASIITHFLSTLILVSCGRLNTNHPLSEPFHWTRNVCSLWLDPTLGNRIDYCVKTSNYPPNSPGKTLYAFHGMGGNAKSMCDTFTAHTQAFATRGSISHVVCPSFGPHWVIHEAGRSESFARFRTFIQQQHDAAVDQKPVLYGESMGGFNVIKVSGSPDRDHIQFQKVVAACPAIFSIRIGSRALAKLIPTSVFAGFDPSTSISIVEDSPYWDGGYQFPEHLILPNQDDPIGQARFRISGMNIEVLGGIYQGAIDFHTSLKQRGQPSQIQVLSGGHCVGIPYDPVIEYLGL